MVGRVFAESFGRLGFNSLLSPTKDSKMALNTFCITLSIIMYGSRMSEPIQGKE